MLRSLTVAEQHAAILAHIARAGHITVREAQIDHAIASPTKRISELRKMGYQIVSEPRRHPVTKQRYVRYKFAPSVNVTGRVLAAQ